MWRVQLEGPARRDLHSLHPHDQRRVVAALEKLTEDPRPHPQSKDLGGDLRGFRRLRVGEMRIAYEVQPAAQLVVVWAVGPRQGFYERLRGRL